MRSFISWLTLSREGVTSKVIAKLLQRNYDRTRDFRKSVMAALSNLKGKYFFIGIFGSDSEAGQILLLFSVTGLDMVFVLFWNLLEDSIQSNIRFRAQQLMNT